MTQEEFLKIYEIEMAWATKDKQDSQMKQDAVQRASVVIFENWERYSQLPKEEVSKYFSVVRKNEFLDLLKEDRKSLGELFDVMEVAYSEEPGAMVRHIRSSIAITSCEKAAEVIKGEDERIDVESAKASLNAEDRRMIEDYHEKDGMTLHKLAREQGVSPSTIQRNIKRIEAHLRHGLSGYQETYGKGHRTTGEEEKSAA